MNIDRLQALTQATLTGSMPFPDIIRELVREDIETYHVDFLSLNITFYNHHRGTFSTTLTYDDIPMPVAEFDNGALRAAIMDSQQNGQPFHEFCIHAAEAGVQSYFVFLTGRRVLYLGRSGDTHIEWFPAPEPA